MQLSIVSYLDEAATGQIRQLQQAMSEVTGSRASLDSWAPHVTLADGVEVEMSEFDGFVDEVRRLADVTQPFGLTVTGFSSLDNRPIGVGEESTPYAIFIDVVSNAALLDLVAQLHIATRTRPIWYHMPQPYLPHVTLAFRDLSASGYAKGLTYLDDKHVELQAQIDHVALVQKLPNTDEEVVRLRFGS